MTNNSNYKRESLEVMNNVDAKGVSGGFCLTPPAGPIVLPYPPRSGGPIDPPIIPDPISPLL